jgi:hypothetical protein
VALSTSTMADQLADELLQMILSPSLNINEERFSSQSSTAFGSNDLVSSSSVLLVCKKWLRVATPLLYEVVVLRSTPQAQALADSFKQNPTFALHAKRMRLEGAYSCLWDIFKHCSNLHTILFTLDIYSSSTVTGLCRSLAAINPTRVILRDSCGTVNANVKKVLNTLCESIPQWTHLVFCLSVFLSQFQIDRHFQQEFEFPSIYDIASVRHAFKGPQLARALRDSPTLQIIVAVTSYKWDEKWLILAENTRITFKFDYGPYSGSPLSLEIARNPQLLDRIQFLKDRAPL